jgi:hypothetical protein
MILFGQTYGNQNDHLSSVIKNMITLLNSPIAIKKDWLYNKGITPYQRYYA